MSGTHAIQVRNVAPRGDVSGVRFFTPEQFDEERSFFGEGPPVWGFVRREMEDHNARAFAEALDPVRWFS